MGGGLPHPRSDSGGGYSTSGLMVEGGYSILGLMVGEGGYPIPGLDGGGYPIPGLDGGYPIPGLDGVEGYLGTPWAMSGWWGGVPAVP